MISFGAETNLRALHLPRDLRGRLVLSSQEHPTQVLRELHGRAAVAGIRMIRRLYPTAAGVVAVSTFIRDVLLRLGVPRVTVSPNPIDLDVVCRRASEPVPGADGPPVVVHVGRHTPVKNIPLLLEAFSLVLAKAKCRLWLCGDGEDRPALESEVRRRGLSGSVTFHGFVSNPYAFVARARCFALTSKREGSPVALLADCELGTHLHAGLVGPNAAHALPAAGVQAMEFQCHDAQEVEHAKMTTLTEAFRSRFRREPRTFRAGRFAAGSNTIRCLEALGYRVDTSVTPHLRWPHERGAVDFRGAPEQPYFPSPDDVARPTERGAVLEVPVSIRRRFWGEPVWLRPWHSTPEQRRALGDLFLRRHGALPFVVLNRMFHSMEVVPGASPAGQTEEECRRYLSMIEDFLRWAGEREARFATASEARDLWAGQ